MRWWTGIGLALVTVGMLLQIVGWALERRQTVKFVVHGWPECITAVQMSEATRLELPLGKDGQPTGVGTLYGVKVTFKASCGRYEVSHE